MFQLTAARRRLLQHGAAGIGVQVFQLTAARRRLRGRILPLMVSPVRFNSQPLEGGCVVSASCWTTSLRFNSQPLEGGCVIYIQLATQGIRFNSQPLEGGCVFLLFSYLLLSVSTHSRSKAAALTLVQICSSFHCFNSQPLEGGCSLHQNPRKIS